MNSVLILPVLIQEGVDINDLCSDFGNLHTGIDSVLNFRNFNQESILS